MPPLSNPVPLVFFPSSSPPPLLSGQSRLPGAVFIRAREESVAALTLDLDTTRPSSRNHFLQISPTNLSLSLP